MESIDRDILMRLQSDARLSMTSLGKRLKRVKGTSILLYS